MTATTTNPLHAILSDEYAAVLLPRLAAIRSAVQDYNRACKRKRAEWPRWLYLEQVINEFAFWANDWHVIGFMPKDAVKEQRDVDLAIAALDVWLANIEDEGDEASEDRFTAALDALCDIVRRERRR